MQTMNRLPRFYVVKTGHLNYQENYALKLSLPVASLDVICVHFKKNTRAYLSFFLLQTVLVHTCMKPSKPDTKFLS